jgi:hypothetical protein
MIEQSYRGAASMLPSLLPRTCYRLPAPDFVSRNYIGVDPLDIAYKAEELGYHRHVTHSAEIPLDGEDVVNGQHGRAKRRGVSGRVECNFRLLRRMPAKVVE